jgi:hypothetical protein
MNSLPKASMASMIMSSDWRDKFQWMFSKLQQLRLKGHSKERWKRVSSLEVLHRTQL